MPIKAQEYNHVCVIAVEGDWGQADLDLARKTFEQQTCGRRLIDFIIDLEKCEFVDSSGLELLLWMKRKVEDLGGQLKLVVVAETLKTILHMTRLVHRFEIHNELAPALKNM